MSEMLRMKCPECAQGRLVPFLRDEEFEYDTGNETVKVNAFEVPVERCNVCGITTSGPQAAKIRDQAICKALGLMSPSEIKELRESYGWSQQDLADLTDFGIATVSRWERGRLLQNRSANKVLLALRDCPAFRTYLEELLKSNATGPGPKANDRTLPNPAANTIATVLKLEQAFQNAREELEVLKQQFGAGALTAEVKP